MKTKEELLKIYSAYLPYEVKFTDYEVHEHYTSTLSTVNIYDVLESENLKLHLYSMDMLTKEIEHNGERFVPLHRLLEEYCFDLSKMDADEILSYAESLVEIDMSFKTTQVLLEWHFNVFNLSENEYIKKEIL